VYLASLISESQPAFKEFVHNASSIQMHGFMRKIYNHHINHTYVNVTGGKIQPCPERPKHFHLKVTKKKKKETSWKHKTLQQNGAMQ